MGARHVAGLWRQHAVLGGGAEGALDLGDHLADRDRVVAAEVDDEVVVRDRRHAHERIDEVVDVGVVAKWPSLVEQLDRLAGGNTTGEGVDRKVGALTRPEHGEQPSHTDRQAGHRLMGMAQRFAGHLRRPVWRDRTASSLVLPEWQPIVDAIDRARRGEHEPCPVSGDVIDRVLEADHVCRHVGVGIRDGGAHAGASGEVEDDVRPRAVEGGAQPIGVRGGRLDQLEPRVALRRDEVAHLPVTGVEIVERIDRGHVPAIGQETVDEGAADEPGAAGDERAGHGQVGMGADRPTPL